MQELQKNKKKNVVIIIIVAIVAIIIAMVVTILHHSYENPYKFTKSGSLYDNISEFDLSSNLEEEDELTKSYFKSIKYEITNIDKDNMTADIEVSTPIISDALSDILDKVIAENSDKDYKELKKIAETELSSLLKSNKLKFEKSTVVLNIGEVDGKYKLIPTEEWNQLLTGNLEKLYKDYLKSLIGVMTNEMPK